MGNVIKKDKSKLFPMVSGILCILVALFYAIYLVAKLFINDIVYPILSGGYYGSNFVADLIYYSIFIVIYSLPLLIAGAVLLIKKNSVVAFIPIGLSAMWFCEMFFNIWRALFVNVLQVFGIYYYEIVYYNIYELIGEISYDLAGLAIAVIEYAMFTVIPVLVVTAIIAVLALLLKKRGFIVAFAIAGVGIVHLALAALYQLQGLFSSLEEIADCLEEGFECLVDGELLYWLDYTYRLCDILLSPLFILLMSLLVIIAVLIFGVGLIMHRKNAVKLKNEAALAVEQNDAMTETPLAENCAEEVAAENATESGPAEEVEPQSAPRINVAEEILRFEDLYNRGIITKDQFEAKKNQLLRM